MSKAAPARSSVRFVLETKDGFKWKVVFTYGHTNCRLRVLRGQRDRSFADVLIRVHAIEQEKDSFDGCLWNAKYANWRLDQSTAS